MYVFLSGAEMQPERVRGLARGEVRGAGALGAASAGRGCNADGVRYETWGIVIETPDAPTTGDEHAARLPTMAASSP